MADYFIGIDIGTSSIKSVLFDEWFREVKVASRPNQTFTPAVNFKEQDMEQVWLSTMETLHEILYQCKSYIGLESAGSIKGIGVTGQGEGLWLADQHGNPVRRAILWSDCRAAEIVNELNQRTALIKQIAQETGSYPIPCNTSMILAWMARYEPESLIRAKYLFFAKDWIRFKLTGVAGLDITDSGTSLLNLRNEKWSEIVFNELNLNNYIHLLSQTGYSSDLFATLSVDIASQLGLSPDIPVCYGALDVAAAALGMGAIDANDIFSIIGTTCCTGVIHPFVKLNNNGERCFPHVVDSYYINATATLSGTPNIDWCLDNIAFSKDFEEIEKQIKQVPAGCGGVIYHPYISGERSPFYNTNARASFFGINVMTSRAHLIRSVYEGVAFTIKDALHDYPAGGKIFLAGGGKKSQCWNQIIADITGRTVLFADSSELSAKGAAILSGMASDVIRDLDKKRSELFTINKTYHPDMKKFELYNELFDVYKTFRINNASLWNKMAEIYGQSV